MGMHDTTAKEEAAKHLQEAREKISSMQDWLKRMDEQLEKQIAEKDGGAFAIVSAKSMMELALAVFNAISMANGACLVRSTK